jgi:hypothetical protein
MSIKAGKRLRAAGRFWHAPPQEHGLVEFRLANQGQVCFLSELNNDAGIQAGRDRADASANSVAHDRNFTSSGEPKMA